jgi:outer membrane receptor protein involved in Fe transport
MNYLLQIAAFALCILVFTEQVFSDGKIIGKVTDSKDNSGIEADVKVLSLPDSNIIGGAKCDANGSFMIENVPFGSLKIEVSFIGYASITLENVRLSEQNTQVILDTIRLKKQDITTDEILVEESKGLIQFSADKKIFNVTQSELTKGGTALDVLKKVPMVDVDVNDNVSMRGSQNVKILIDDKPSRYASLKQIPADAIERVELITEGVTGLINIVMKKNNNLGFTGSTSFGGNYNQKLAGWGGIDINLKKKSWTVFTGIYSGTWNNNFSYTRSTDYFTPASSLDISSLGKNNGHWIWGQGGIERELSPGKSIGFEANFGTGKWFNTDNSTNNNLNSLGELTSYYTQANERNGLWENMTGSFYYNLKLNDEGKDFSGDLTFSRNKHESKFGFVKQDYDSLSVPLNNSPLDQRDTTLNKSYNLNAQADYTHPLSAISKIETGYKGTFRLNDNDFNSDTLDYSSGNYQTNENVNNHFKLNEYINAVYGVFSSTIGDFSYKLGIRVEQTNTLGELVTLGQDFKKSYFDVFPTVNISQKISGVHQVQLSYSRRITRPNIWRMNPFVNRFNPRFLHMGNPDLDPEYTDSYELSLMLSTPVLSVTPLAFFRQNHGVISSYSFLIDTNVSLTTYRNAAGSKAYGLDLLLSSRALSWLNLNATFSFYNTKFDEDALMTDYAAEEGFSWRTNIRSSLTLKYFNLELYYTYTGEKVNAQGTDLPTSSFDASVSKSFLEDKLTVSLRANDIFSTQQWGQDINAADYVSSFRNDWSSRMISLNFSLKFGNTSESFQKKKKQKQNTNEGSDQQDNSQGR